ncbi:MAG TPA: ABC transporter permease [Spirochaetia bacterium]|nr:ABC transporter permease [Spirochaetia bacterium]HRZ63452.1 ABC transporter permease [Spirochaetia bacterium]
MRKERLAKLLFGIGALALALGISTLVLLAAKAPPLAAYANIALGALGSWDVAANVLVSWVPLVLATSGLLVTFTAGLWNIGIEGQITLGAIFATWALRALQGAALPPALAIGLAFAAGMAGGALWALLTGALRTFGGVNEIFGGLGLNFVSTALNIWLIFGPWKRPGVASMSGTVPFDKSLWLPTLAPGSRLAPASLALALAGIALVFVLLRGSYFGLRLKAVGRNPRAALLLGIPAERYLLAAFLGCGLLAGLAGAVQVTAVYHRLIPSISSGYGYLGLMVAMLASNQAPLAALVALFFAALNVGSIRLPIVLKLDSSLAGVLQGSLVLFFLLGQGARQRLLERKRGGRP